MSLLPPPPPPPPPPAPLAFRDEIVTSLDKDDDKKKSDEDVLDLSQLALGDDLTEIDTGVTSGADPSDWDPISVDDDKNADQCTGAGSQSASTEGSPAACGVKQK